MNTEPIIRINVDITNPGQFFACCGLLELADRLYPGTEGWFEASSFCIKTAGGLRDLLDPIANVELEPVAPENKTSSPIRIGPPFQTIILDWWHDNWSGGKELKVWAGTMESVRIARAMQLALQDDRFTDPNLFNLGQICHDPANPKKKVEPYYFDARRGPNAHSRDVGFSPNDLSMTTTAFPAVELLCLVGLQRCRPRKTDKRRVYDYFTWTLPLGTEVVSTVVNGNLTLPNSRQYRFENWYRTGQKKHKAFRSATPIH